MTWAEFKKQVDDKLTEIGADQDIEIQYIDVSFIYREFSIGVDLDKKSMAIIE